MIEFGELMAYDAKTIIRQIADNNAEVKAFQRLRKRISDSGIAKIEALGLTHPDDYKHPDYEAIRSEQELILGSHLFQSARINCHKADNGFTRVLASEMLGKLKGTYNPNKKHIYILAEGNLYPLRGIKEWLTLFKRDVINVSLGKDNELQFEVFGSVDCVARFQMVEPSLTEILKIYDLHFVKSFNAIQLDRFEYKPLLERQPKQSTLDNLPNRISVYTPYYADGWSFISRTAYQAVDTLDKQALNEQQLRKMKNG